MKRKRTLTTKVIAILLFVLCGLVFMVRSASDLDHEKRCNYIRKRAQKAESKGDAATAREQFLEAVSEAEQSQNPLQLPGVLIDLARIYSKGNKRTEAETCLLRAITVYDSLPLTINDAAGDLTVLITEKQQMARVELARLYIKDGKLKEAKQLFEKALAKGADEYKKEYLQLLKMLGDGHASKLEGRLETDFAKFFYSGVTAIQQSRLDLAEREISTAIEIARGGENDRQLLQAVPYMAIIQTERGNDREAEQLLRDMLNDVDSPLQFSREFAECLQLQTALIYLRGDKVLAKKTYHDAIALNPTQAATRGLIPALKECLKRQHPEHEDLSIHEWLFSEHKQMYENKQVEPEAILSTLGEEACVINRPTEAEKYFHKLATLEGKAPNIASLSALHIVLLAHSYDDVHNYPASLRLWDEIIKRGDPTSNSSMVIYRCKAHCLFHESGAKHSGEITSLIRKQWDHFNDKSIYPPMLLDEDIDLIQQCSIANGKTGDRLRILHEALSCADRTWHLPVLYEHLLASIGDEQIRRKQFETAATTFTHLVETKSKSNTNRDELIESECRLILCLQSSGRDDKAKELIKTVLDLGCEDKQKEARCKSFALFNLGAIAAKEEKFERADETYSRARIECSDSVANCLAVIEVVSSLTFNHKFAALKRLAAGQISSMESSNSKQSAELASLLFALAEAYKQEGQYKQADQLCRRALSIYQTCTSSNSSPKP